MGERRLHIGGVVREAGWEVLNASPGAHVDHVGDARDLSRFAEGTFQSVYGSHILEHIDYNGPLQAALKEWARVLAPGGTLYVSVPDLDVLCELFLLKDKLSVDQRFQIMRMIFGGHTDPHDFHQAGLNEEFLTIFLRDAGFTDIRRVESFGLFQDTSEMRAGQVLISVNLIAHKPE